MQSSWQEHARPKPKSRARARGRCTEKQDESALAPSHEWTRRVPSTFESSPSKSIADFPSDEKLASATPAVTSELEAKLRQRMLKCEGKDCLYKPQVSKFLDQPSSPPARLKLAAMKANPEIGGPPKTELPSETALVDELELTASYRRCTQAQGRGCFSHSRMRARKRSSPHVRRGEKQGIHNKASLSRRRSPQAASQRRRGRPSIPTTPTLQDQGSDHLPSVSTTTVLPDKVFGSGLGGSQDCRQNDHGVPMFALDDPERDAVQECSGSPVRSRSMGSPDTSDPGVDEDPGMSIEECLFDLVNHVPPGIAQKMSIALQHLQRDQPDGVLQEVDLSLKPPAPCLQDYSGFGDCQGRLDWEGDSTQRLEAEARDAEEQARLCASELLRERVVWSQELAESRACTTWLEQSGRAAESRAEVEVSQMVAELELLHTRFLGEQAQLHGLRARLEEAEWQCNRHLNETRTSSNEAVTWRQHADDMERRLQESQQQGRLCFEELSKSRDYQRQLQMECAAETKRAAQATSDLEELQAMSGQRVRGDVPCIRKCHSEDQRAVSTCTEEWGGTRDAFRMPARQGEDGTSGLVPRRRGTQLASQASRAAERELRSELALALAEVDRQSKLRKVADMLNEKNSCEHNEMEAELAKAVSDGAALRCELRGAEEMLRQEKIHTEALDARLRESGPEQRSHLLQTPNSKDRAVHRQQELSSPLHDQGVVEKGHARRSGRLREERERRRWADSEHVGLAVERQALSGWLAAASADCLRAREQEAYLAGELATTRSRLEQEEEQLQVERLQLLELTCEAPLPLRPDSDLQEAQERAMELWAAAAMEQWLSHSSGCSRSPSPGAESKSQPSPRPSCTASHPDLSSQSPAAPKPAGSQPPRPSSSRRADFLKRQQLLSKSQEMLRLEDCCKAVSLEMTAQTQALAESETQRQQLNSHTQATVLEAAELWKAMGLRAVAHEREFWQAEMLRERLEEKATLMVREAEAKAEAEAEAATSHTQHTDDNQSWQSPPDRGRPQCRPPPSFDGEGAALGEPL